MRLAIYLTLLQLALFSISLYTNLCNGNESVSLKVMLFLSYKKHILHEYRIKPAFDIAMDTIKDKVQSGEYLNFSISYIFSDQGCTGPRVLGPGIASRIYTSNNISAVFGPPCTSSGVGVSDLAALWNIPMLSGATTGSELGNKKRHTHLIRTSPGLDGMAVFFGRVMKLFGWKRVANIADFNSLNHYFGLVGNAIQSRLLSEGYSVNKFSLPTFDSVTDVLIAATRRARIIIISAYGEIVREIMVAAYDLGYINGEYAFLAYHPFNNSWEYGNYHWKQGDGLDEKARLAYDALLHVRLFEPSTPEFAEFERQVARRQKEVYNWTHPEGDTRNYYAAAFHDALLLYANVINQTIAEGGDVQDGAALVQKMQNITFKGITGMVAMKPNGDRDADYSLYDFSGDQFYVVASYYGASGTMVMEGEVHWPGGALEAPPDTPFCGFDNENPACHPKETISSIAIAGACLAAALIITLIIGLLIYRKLKINAELKNLTWKITWNDLTFRGTGKSMRSSFSVLRSTASGLSHNTDEPDGQLFANVAAYKGRLVVVKRINKVKIDLTRDLLVEMNNMRHVEHPNVVRFVGACIDIPNVAAIVEYCPKGSLQDILENDSLKLDWTFKISLMKDIFQGLHYIHSSVLKRHGGLSSSNCVVDSRFVLKLTDFGLEILKRGMKQEDGDHITENKLLWKAPEYLRQPDLVQTKEGDMYGAGIIMQEIVTRGLPFDAERQKMEVQGILAQVRAKQSPPFRPSLSVETCNNNKQLKVLFEKCWAENPSERPSASIMLNGIKRCSKDKSGGILDNLLMRMEQYANNLESLVEERTSALVEEKKRSEKLLYQVLPKSVANQLKRGEIVEPETYSSVTIFFSDIVGFTSLSAESTPLQVVLLLNDLYTCFDETIEAFDVFKVETIGDAYMVVSGLPIRNGDDHAKEIALMSLALTEKVNSFEITHRPDQQLKLRVGIHSGPCAAGVVGLKMPRYCLFGDTVNTTSRMESNGEALKIHISESTKNILDKFGSFIVELRGHVEMKGKGIQTTYWLKSYSEENSTTV